jgi:methionyl-tRNA synthetase
MEDQGRELEVAPGQITFEQWRQVDIRVGQVKSVEKVVNKDRLLKLVVDFGSVGERTVIAGIAPTFSDPNAWPEKLIGKRFGFVINLEPRKMAGIVSQAMILAAPDEHVVDQVVLIGCGDAQIGSRLAARVVSLGL